ncbi:hypothetical protein ACSJEN_002791 [Yersinia enterocolitica]
MIRYKIKKELIKLLLQNNIKVLPHRSQDIPQDTYLLFIGDMQEQDSVIQMSNTRRYQSLNIDFICVGYSEEQCNEIMTQVMDLVINDSTYKELATAGINVSTLTSTSGYSNSERNSTEMVHSVVQTINLNYLKGR